MERSIIHLNIADFAAAVETRISPGLAGFPLVIAPSGTARAVVFDMNNKAFEEGVRKGMPLVRVRRLVPGARILPPRFNRYERVMGQIAGKALAYTPKVEPGREDGHIFLDVTGTSRLFGPPVDVAFRLKKAVKKDLNLDPIWSLATSKTVAKVATRLVKPFGEYIVGPGEEEGFLSPLPLCLIPGLSREELALLNSFNLSTVSGLKALTLSELEVPFPGRSRVVHDLLRGIDPAPVLPDLMPAGNLARAGREFARDTNDRDAINAGLYALVEEICISLRQQGMVIKSLCIVLSHSDGIQRSAKGKLSPWIAAESAVFKAGSRILDRAWTRRVRVRHMELICEKAVPPALQGDLFSALQGREQLERQACLAGTLDKIRDKFGPGAVRPGLALAGDDAMPEGGTVNLPARNNP